MLKLEYSREAVEALRYWRFHHPHPLVQLKMEVVLLRSQGVSNEQIQSICGISKATLYRYLHEYHEGGVERLKALHFIHIPHPFSWVYDGFAGSALKLNLENHIEP